MKFRSGQFSNMAYLVFCIPFVLAYFSWAYFPLLAEWLIENTFRYEVIPIAPNWLWFTTIQFFYTWYTFLAIGIAGMWAIAATLARGRGKEVAGKCYPMVSFIIPAYEEEEKISRCISSLFRCAEEYEGLCEIIIVDDGSKDFTYEVAWAAIELNRRRFPRVRGKVVRHSVNLGKVEAVKTGVSKGLGSVIAIVDADSSWMPSTLRELVNYMLSNGKKAVTGYVHPSDGNADLNPYVVLQQLEYSQGLGISRCAQSLGDNVLVVSGAIGLYDAQVLREILNKKDIYSVTEDLEITLEMHKRGVSVGYIDVAHSTTMAPLSFDVLWNQRLRWFMGWLHNTLSIHKDMLLKKSWLTLLLWYCYIFEYGGVLIDLVALGTFPFLFWFAPDRILFILNLFVFIPYGFLIGAINQAIALKISYNSHNYKSLLFYTPFYPILRFINMLARLISSIKYLSGNRGNWRNPRIC